jgi:LAO/AO transport system ATPase
MPPLNSLLERFRHGDRWALSRLLSLVDRGEQLPKIRAALAGRPAPRVIAITGSAGVGKSTLIGRLIEHLRRERQNVAVLACDPQSPLSGGALLGDRFRMPTTADDDGVFIRSLAALSGHGAVADHLPVMTDLLGAFGFGVVLVETVGAGQGDVSVSELADVVVLLLQPETGDDLQWEKAGVLEIADVIAVQKADLPGAEHVAAQVRATLALSDKKPIPPAVLVSAKTGQGVAELWQHIVDAVPTEHHEPDAADRLLRLVQEEVAARFKSLRIADDPALCSVLGQVGRGEIASADAAEVALKAILSSLRK